MRIIKLNYDNGASVVIPLEDIRIVEGGASIDIYTPYRDGPYQFNLDIDSFVGLAYAEYDEEGEYIIIDINEATPAPPAP
jgi:hypothetical protein